jgi:hypothetical protein
LIREEGGKIPDHESYQISGFHGAMAGVYTHELILVDIGDIRLCDPSHR